MRRLGWYISEGKSSSNFQHRSQISFAVIYSAMDSSTVPSHTPALSYAPEDGAIVLHSSSSSSSGHSPSESVDEKETPPPSVKEIEFKIDPEALPPKTGTTATRYLKREQHPLASYAKTRC